MDEFNGVLSKYTSTTFEYSSFMLFSRQPLDSDNRFLMSLFLSWRLKMKIHLTENLMGLSVN